MKVDHLLHRVLALVLLVAIVAPGIAGGVRVIAQEPPTVEQTATPPAPEPTSTSIPPTQAPPAPTATDGVVIAEDTAAPTSTPQPCTTIALYCSVRVQAEGFGLNLRATASTSGTVVTLMPENSIAQVIGGPTTGSGYTWWQLRYNGKVGWSVAPYLVAIPGTPMPTATSTAAPTQSPTRTATTTRTATASQTATLTRTATGSPTETGIPTETLTPTPSVEPSNTPTGFSCSTIQNGCTVRVNTGSDGLNLRATASTSGTIVAVMPNGATATVIGGPTSANGYTWWRLMYNNTAGWAVGAYLVGVGGSPATPTNTGTPTSTATASATATVTPTPTITQTASLTATVGTPSATATISCGTIATGCTVRVNGSGSGVNLRSSPSTSGSIVKVMADGSTATVIGGPTSANGYTWWQLSQGGSTGWAAGSFLVSNPCCTPSPTPSLTPTATQTRTATPTVNGAITRYVNTDVLNVRASASTSAEILGRLMYGQQVTLQGGTSNGFSAISYGGGTGWVWTDYLTSVKPVVDSAYIWVPTKYQERSLSCEYASLQIATTGLGHPVWEGRFISVVGYNANPHLGFRGNIDAPWGGITNYGVYPEALARALPTFGFTGHVFYGPSATLKEYLRAGMPVLVWFDYRNSGQYYNINGSWVLLAPYDHVVVAYGYDSGGVYISDPAKNARTQVSWSTFNVWWGDMEQMALAVEW